jgi:predicted GIY-YIG superfamily endonuclease
MYCVYRHFDADDRLLYVGMSINPLRRLEQHRYRAEWFSRIAKVTIEWFDECFAASEAEIAAIKAEKPEYNVAYSQEKAPPEKDGPVPTYAISDGEMIDRVYVFLAGHSRAEYGPDSFGSFKRNNPEIMEYLAETAKDDIVPMSEQSYRNWKSKGFTGYQIPNDDDVIEANSED